jgi:hypothetical protein
VIAGVVSRKYHVHVLRSSSPHYDCCSRIISAFHTLFRSFLAWLLFTYSLFVQRVIVAPNHTQLHTHTHSVGLLWTRDRPDAETSTRQHTVLMRESLQEHCSTLNSNIVILCYSFVHKCLLHWNYLCFSFRNDKWKLFLWRERYYAICYDGGDMKTWFA